MTFKFWKLYLFIMQKRLCKQFNKRQQNFLDQLVEMRK